MKGLHQKYRPYLLIAGVTGLLWIAAVIVEGMSPNIQLLQELSRNAPGEGSQDVTLLLDAEELLQEYTYSLVVPEQVLTDSEAEEVFQAAEQELEQVILGENDCLEEISENLYIPTQLQDGLVTVECSFQPFRLVDLDGVILWENMEGQQELVKVEAKLECQEREVIHEFYLNLLPKPAGEVEALLLEIQDKISGENQKQGISIRLPQEVNGRSLTWHSRTEARHPKILLLGLAVLVGRYVYRREKQNQEEKRRNRELTLYYPEIVSQLSLLTGAGMTVSAAWGKIAGEYRSNREKNKIPPQYGYEEMLNCWYEMQDGVSESKAYENFGYRCGQPQYRKFASILVQNIRKGTKGMQQLLKAESREAFLQRKNRAGQLGEEAGTKLLISMGLMLALVFVILLVPAMLSMQM